MTDRAPIAAALIGAAIAAFGFCAWALQIPFEYENPHNSGVREMTTTFNKIARPNVTLEPGSLVRRVNELKAENATLRLTLRQVRTELATLRSCLGGVDPAAGRELARAVLSAFERATLDGRVELRTDGNLHRLARQAAK